MTRQMVTDMTSTLVAIAALVAIAVVGRAQDRPVPQLAVTASHEGAVSIVNDLPRAITVRLVRRSQAVDPPTEHAVTTLTLEPGDELVVSSR